MDQQQDQLLAALCSIYGDSVDFLSLAAPTARAQSWLDAKGIRVKVLRGIYPLLAYLNTTLWYGGGAVLCNKLRWVDRFYFPLRTPLPGSWIDRYSVIVCYYPWGHRLLRLDRAGNKVIMDLGDIMADRHERVGARRWITMTTKDENAVFHSGARCVAVSESDAQEFEKLYGVRAAVMNFVPPDHRELLEIAEQERPPRIGFMGAPSYVNEEIMRLLAQPQFLECLRQAGIELVVAGGICRTVDPSLLRSLEQGGARVMGRVPSTMEYYRQIGAALNPVGPTTGVKIKSIEALVAGRTLITTQWGVDSSLYRAFLGQIVYTDWPVDPQGLGRLAVEVVRSASSRGASAARAYVEESERRLRELHTI
ncbi:MAG TPA: glycosyltransferase [Terracidiphilus sp.]|jgi:hypothetical protein